MARLPLPPSSAKLRKSFRPEKDIHVVTEKTRIVRIFTALGQHPQQWNVFRRFGPLPHGRFDPQRPLVNNEPTEDPENGVLYFSRSVRTSVAEVFQLSMVVDRTTRSPHLAILRPVRPLRLLNLSGVWPTRAGASQSLASGPKRITQLWARAVRAEFPDLDGLWYRSSMDSGNPALCLWDPPAGAALPITPELLLPLNHPGLDIPLSRICEELNYVLLP